MPKEKFEISNPCFFMVARSLAFPALRSASPSLSPSNGPASNPTSLKMQQRTRFSTSRSWAAGVDEAKHVRQSRLARAFRLASNASRGEEYPGGACAAGSSAPRAATSSVWMAIDPRQSNSTLRRISRILFGLHSVIVAIRRYPGLERRARWNGPSPSSGAILRHSRQALQMGRLRRCPDLP
jgi:hypothetical protein